MSDPFAAELEQLRADVAAQGTVIAGASAAFQGLAGLLAVAETAARNAGATEAQIASLTALRHSLTMNSAALAAAVPANTVAAAEVLASPSMQAMTVVPAGDVAAAIQSTALAQP